MSTLATLDTGTLELGDVIKRAAASLAPLKRNVSSVTSVSKTPEGWRATVELVERPAIPDTMDLLGVYEVRLDPHGELSSYERIRVRRRGDLEERLE